MQAHLLKQWHNSAISEFNKATKRLIKSVQILFSLVELFLTPKLSYTNRMVKPDEPTASQRSALSKVFPTEKNLQ